MLIIFKASQWEISTATVVTIFKKVLPVPLKFLHTEEYPQNFKTKITISVAFRVSLPFPYGF